MGRYFWDAHSTGWDKMRSEPETHAQIVAVIDTLMKRLPPGGTVADLGCGTGQHAIELAAPWLRRDRGRLLTRHARTRSGSRPDASVAIDFRAADLNEDLPFGYLTRSTARCASRRSNSSTSRRVSSRNFGVQCAQEASS